MRLFANGKAVKIGHSTALALVGWYLMLPPTVDRDRAFIYAPLSEWKLIEKFDSEGACEQMRTKLVERMPDSAIDTTRCVPSETPFLNPQGQPKIVG